MYKRNESTEFLSFLLGLGAIVISCIGIGFEIGVQYESKHSKKREAFLIENISDYNNKVKKKQSPLDAEY